MRLGKIIAVLLAISLLLTGCFGFKLPVGNPSSSSGSDTSKTSAFSKVVQPSSKLTTGDFNGSDYVNGYFGLTFSVPESWTIATKEEMQEIFGVAEKEVGLTGEDLKDEKLLYLALAAKYDLGNETNPNVNVIAENLAGAENQVKTPADYMKIAIGNFSKDAQEAYGEIGTETVNDVDYAYVSASFNYDGVETAQTQICTLKKGYVLIFTFTYYNEAELNELTEIADTISFD